MDWPLPPPGRPRHAWLLGLGLRRWRLRRQLRWAIPWIPPTARIADLGGGLGTDLEELRGLVPPDPRRRWLLLDAQGEMLRMAREAESPPGGQPPPMALADAARLPLRDQRWDVVLSIGLLCCVAPSAIPDAVRESVRVLAPGGVLVLGVPRRRGREDEAALTAAGLVRVAGGRPGRAVFQKPGGPSGP